MDRSSKDTTSALSPTPGGVHATGRRRPQARAHAATRGAHWARRRGSIGAPVIAHPARDEGSDVVALVGPVFAPDKLGVAMPTGSALRDSFNRALLVTIGDELYRQIMAQYLGEAR